MLVLITNRKSCGDGQFVKTIKEAADGGVDLVILREKDLNHEERLELTMALKGVLKDGQTKLVVHSDVVAAKKVKVDGIHMTFNDFMTWNDSYDGLIGVSVHSVYEALQVSKKGADYVLASHIFPTACKQGLKPKGLQIIKEIRELSAIKVFGLGGIDEENIDSVMESGASGAAVMSLLMGNYHPKETALKLKKKICKYC